MLVLLVPLTAHACVLRESIGLGYTLTDQPHQVLQLTFIRGLDALKPGSSVVAIHIDAVQSSELLSTTILGKS